MNTDINKDFEEALRDQQLIFGDDLLNQINIPNLKKRDPVAEESVIREPVAVIQRQHADSVDVSKEKFQEAKSLEDLDCLINNCEKCELGKSRKNFVFGTGNPNADVMVIGEAPGADEDLQGKPFVGRAGQLLTDILNAIKFEREEVFIANILKCRPPNNRNPKPLEMELCLPYLKKQIELIKPKAILLLGLTAAKGILELNLSLTKMRGKVYDFEGIKTMVTFHPAALLRNPNWKRGCWEDVQAFKKLYEESLG